MQHTTHTAARSHPFSTAQRFITTFTHTQPLPGGNVDGMRTSAAGIRDHAAATLSPETQQRLEQFLMPAPVADQAAN